MIGREPRRVARAAKRLDPEPRVTGAPAVTRWVVRATCDLSDNGRVRRARGDPEARADPVFPELPHGHDVQVVASVVTRSPTEPLSPAPTHAVRVRHPPAHTGRRVPARHEVSAVRPALCDKKLIARDLGIL